MMIPNIPQLKRLPLLLLALIISVLLVAFLLFTFQLGEAADLQSDEILLQEAQPTPTTDPFNLADPFVCIIPNDGTFLPCHANLLADEIPVERSSVLVVESAACVDGTAAGFPCDQVDLLSQLTLDNFDGVKASDIWGWTDPSNGNEIVILTLRDRTVFIDATDALDPQIIGTLWNPLGAKASAWRDVKTYSNTAYIVGDIAGSFGMQIFDLTRLRGVAGNVLLTADNLYQGISSTHNIVINEETGLAALVGISSGVERCSGGMHLLDLSVNRLNPTFAGCVEDDGYVHDAQCVIYHGVDVAYNGREICFNFNEDTITIVDVTDRANPVQISRTGYPQSAYTHQGWLTADHEILLADDEGDEGRFGIDTTTHIWDLTSLAAPKLIEAYTAETKAIDHNQYVHLGYSFQANYRAGMRILDTAEVYDGRLSEVAYFDIFPSNDSANFNAAWSTYPYFESGVIAISGVEQGLFLVKPTGLESYRASIGAPELVTVTSGSTINYAVDVHTLGLSDTYTFTLITSPEPGWTISLTQPAVFTGSPTQTKIIPISIGVPFTDSGQLEMNLILESHLRPGYTISATTQFNIIQGELFDVVQTEPITSAFEISGTMIELPIQIKNRSGLPEQFLVEVAGDSWLVEPSVEQTPPVDGNGTYELSLLMDAVAGIQTSYTLTVTPQSYPTGVQTLEGAVEVQAGVNTNYELTRSSEKITYTLQLTNSGDLPDVYDIVVGDGIWAAQLSVTHTEPISPQMTTTVQLIVDVGLGGESVNQVGIVSQRLGREAAAIEFISRNYQLLLPIVSSATSAR
ncbi:MAG: choice-of-anchor B family protein [Anaerolineae bacterium]